MGDDCKRIAAALENIQRDLITSNLLLARLADHLGLPSPDGDSVVTRLIRSQALARLNTPDADTPPTN